MSNGQNTQNIGLGLNLLASLLSNAAMLSATIKNAQAAGNDLTDDQLKSFTDAYDAASAQLGQDIEAARQAASPPAAG